MVERIDPDVADERDAGQDDEVEGTMHAAAEES